MYQHILVALENGPADALLLEHIKTLAKTLKSRVMLLHVADGFAARNRESLDLADSEEIKADQRYLDERAQELATEGLVTGTRLAAGNPPEEIVKAAEAEKCDLIALGAHGHKFLGDLVHGSTVTPVRHNTTIPVLVIRSGKQP
ncbi:MAG TPA: universal stress protein [Planctomycetota bacterium]|nr:universal stress protein [Planctomycetota bacterium]